MNFSWKRIISGGLAILLVGFGLIQLVPYGRGHSNPPVVQEPNWDSPQTRELAQQACYDCHSNEVTWPWYSNIAPISWLVQHDVEEGRRSLNFSDWERSKRTGASREMTEVILEGGMPPLQYRLARSQARLTAAEKEALARGLTATAQR